MAYNFQPLKDGIKKVEEKLRADYQSISTGRANPALLDAVQAEAYGSYQPIKNLANISVEDPRTLRITPWDTGIVREIESALQKSGLPITTAVDDKGLRVAIPQLTEESKQSLTKLARTKLEEARISVRSERQKLDKEIDTAEKDKKISEDDKFRAKEELQKIVDEANKMLEELAKKKESDIMAV